MIKVILECFYKGKFVKNTDIITDNGESAIHIVNCWNRQVPWCYNIIKTEKYFPDKEMEVYQEYGKPRYYPKQLNYVTSID